MACPAFDQLHTATIPSTPKWFSAVPCMQKLTMPHALQVHGPRLMVWLVLSVIGGVLLARSELDDCHAFRWQQHVWGLQFHPEFSRTTMQGYVQARREALQAEGIDHRELHDKVSATPHARQVLRRFVRHARAARHR